MRFIPTGLFSSPPLFLENLSRFFFLFCFHFQSKGLFHISIRHSSSTFLLNSSALTDDALLPFLSAFSSSDCNGQSFHSIPPPAAKQLASGAHFNLNNGCFKSEECLLWGRTNRPPDPFWQLRRRELVPNHPYSSSNTRQKRLYVPLTPFHVFRFNSPSPGWTCRLRRSVYLSSPRIREAPFFSVGLLAHLFVLLFFYQKYRKKCDENRRADGTCDTCKRLRLQCLGWVSSTFSVYHAISPPPSSVPGSIY